MKFVPKVVYNGVTLNFSKPQGLWTPYPLLVGGTDKTGSGIPESFIQRTEQLCDVKLRFTEAEHASVMTWLEWAQANGSGGSFTFWFDKNDAATAYTCYLEGPDIGKAVKPTRDDYKRVFKLDIVLRSTNGTRFSAGAHS